MVDGDSFVLDQVERDPAGMLGVIDAMAARRRRHPKTRHDILATLSVLLPRAASELMAANDRGG